MSIMDLIAGAMGQPDPRMQLLQALGQAPGQPGGGPAPVGPAPANGAPGAPMAPQQQQQPQPQAYTSPPDLAQAYMQLAMRQQASDSLDRHLGLIAASAYPGRRPDVIMAGMAGGQRHDPGELFNNLLQLQQYQLMQGRYADLMNNSDKYAASFGVDPNMFRATIQAAGPQEAGQVLGRIAEAQMGLTGSQTDKEWKNAIRTFQAQNPGQPLPPDMQTEAAWDQSQREQVTTRAAQAKDVQAFKDSAVEDFSTVDPKFAKNEKTVAQLLSNMPATMSALQAPDFLTTGKLPGWLPGGGPYGQDVKNAAVAMNTLRAELSSEGLRNVKNVRNVREFNTLGAALTSAFDPSNSQEQVKTALEDLQTQFLNAHATATLAAGKQLTGALIGHGDRAFLDSNNPYYNKGTEAAPDSAAPAASGGALKPLSADDLAQAKTLIARDGRDHVISQLKAAGYDTSGL